MITASTSLLALTQLPAIVSLAISTGSVPLSTAFDAAVTVNDPFSSSIKAPLLFGPPDASYASIPIVTVITVYTTTKTVTDRTTTTRFSVDPQPTRTITATKTVFTPPPSSSTLNSDSPGLAWNAPSTMTDLTSFNISRFASGGQNLQIVNAIPPSAYYVSPPVPSGPTSSVPFIVSSDESPETTNSTLIQIFYPANSINPGNAETPVGGAEFYAHPVEIRSATSVTLNYSIFFPVDFDFVLGGKLPGLYGGHTGCSGGDSALDCFSTRLMFRPGAVGELYLYAPKAEQTEALCTDAQSVCSAVYGLSIGRGSFVFTRGGWTHLSQTVVLNTPGKQDGTFALDVDDERVISRNDVFYRAVIPPLPKTTPPPLLPTVPLADGPVKVPVPQPPPIPAVKVPVKVPKIVPPAVKAPDVVAHPPVTILPAVPLSPPSLFGGLFGNHRRRRQFLVSTAIEQASYKLAAHDEPLPAPIILTSTSTVTTIMLETAVPLFLQTTTTTATQIAVPSLWPDPDPNDESMAQRKERTIQFEGVFFSTFFGGHEERYATPKDQYLWFKDFAVQNNDLVGHLE